jgi:hypothetical protein
LNADAPDFGAQLAVRLADRMFEFVFLAKRTRAEQDAIVTLFLEMVTSELQKYATPAGIDGIAADEFMAILAAPAPD